MTVRLTLLGPTAVVRAQIELTRPGAPDGICDADARLAARLAGYLTRPQPVRPRGACVAVRPSSRTGIII